MRGLKSIQSISLGHRLFFLLAFNPRLDLEQKTHFINVKNDIKNYYFQEKYRYYIRGKGQIFDKQYLLLSNLYVKT